MRMIGERSVEFDQLIDGLVANWIQQPDFNIYPTFFDIILQHYEMVHAKYFSFLV